MSLTQPFTRKITLFVCSSFQLLSIAFCFLSVLWAFKHSWCLSNWQDHLSWVIMACSLKSVFYVPKLNESMLLGTKHVEAKSSTYTVLSTDFIGKPIVLSEVNGSKYSNLKTSRDVSINVCKSIVSFCFATIFFFHIH